jgi:hypothetical protein
MDLNVAPVGALFDAEFFKDERKTLAKRFGAPPFSVLRCESGNWPERKEGWLQIVGIRGEEGREADTHSGAQCNDFGKLSRSANTTSVFDPVLCECMYKWFAPAGGSILDPFAGESTKGIVAGYLGYRYIGIELRQEQVDANMRQAEAVASRFPDFVMPVWVCSDSSKLGEALDAAQLSGASIPDQFDFVWTSPPYYDLEIYSKSEKDGSAFETYEKFMVWYRDIFRQCVERMAPNRFLAVKVGEVRNKDNALGNFYQFERDNMDVFEELGGYHYNRFVLVTATGSMPTRVGKFHSYRKAANGHQMVYVYWFGQPDYKVIAGALGEIKKGDVDESMG